MPRCRLSAAVVLPAALAGALVALPGAASAAQIVCVPSAAGSPLLTPTSSGCTAGHAPDALWNDADMRPVLGRIAQLEDLLAGVSRGASVGGQDTLTFRGMNVQITNGAGSNASRNGRGNLVVGYRTVGSITGSHNVVAGDANSVTSTGGIVGGSENIVSGPNAVAFGWRNSASAGSASVTGGVANVAASTAASVSGGCGNVAGLSSAPVIPTTVRDQCIGSGFVAAPWIGGGRVNRSVGRHSAVVGGEQGTASGLASSLLAGRLGQASGGYSVLGGGNSSSATGSFAGAFGGVANVASGDYSFVGTGFVTQAQGQFSAALGGGPRTLTGTQQLYPTP